MIDVDFDIKTKLCTVDTLVIEKPCWVYSIICTGDSHDHSIFGFYNGRNANAELLTKIQVRAFETLPYPNNAPIRFSAGLYLKFIADGDWVFIQYKPDF